MQKENIIKQLKYMPRKQRRQWWSINRKVLIAHGITWDKITKALQIERNNK